MLERTVEGRDVSLRFLVKGGVVVVISFFFESIYLVYACLALLALTAYLSIRELENDADQQLERNVKANKQSEKVNQSNLAEAISEEPIIKIIPSESIPTKKQQPRNETTESKVVVLKSVEVEKSILPSNVVVTAPVIKPEQIEFEHKRDAYRKARIVPGVSGFSDFDKRRQGLAEKALPQLRKLIEKEYGNDPSALCFLTDYACYRFLRAREGNAEAAMVMIRATINWRRKKDILQNKARCITCETVNPRAHAYFCIGHDIYDRAVMYSCSVRAMDQKDIDGGIFHMVAEMEHFLNDTEGVAQIVWIVDFNGFSAKHSNPENGRQAAHLFQQVYPERLGQLVLLDFPWIFSIFFKIVSPLLDPVTRNKILILRTEADRQKYYTEHWTPEMVSWMNEIAKLPPVPGVYPKSSTIRSRHWQ